MVDMHTHVLHNIDDGPKTLEESISLIEKLEQAGVTDIVATSHYFSASTSIEDFYVRGTKRLEELRKAVADKNIGVNIYFGAEVHIDKILLNYSSLEKLCFENTDYILLEIPPAFFSEDAFELIDKIVSYYPIKPIIAHAERYSYLKNTRALTYLKQMGCIIQADTECILGKSLCARLFAFKMIKEGLVDIVASDCHDTKKRKSNLNLAYDAIEKKLGKQTVERLKANALKLISK